MNKDLFQVISSHGTLFVDRSFGVVYTLELLTDDIAERIQLASIKSFDLAEYKEYYKTDAIPDSVDILNMGYTYIDTRIMNVDRHEEPCHDWREMRGLIEEPEELFDVVTFSSFDDSKVDLVRSTLPFERAVTLAGILWDTGEFFGVQVIDRNIDNMEPIVWVQSKYE